MYVSTSLIITCVAFDLFRANTQPQGLFTMQLIQTISTTFIAIILLNIEKYNYIHNFKSHNSLVNAIDISGICKKMLLICLFCLVVTNALSTTQHLAKQLSLFNTISLKRCGSKMSKCKYHHSCSNVLT